MGNTPHSGRRSSDSSDESGSPVRRSCPGYEFYDHHRPRPPRYKLADNTIVRKANYSFDSIPSPPSTTIPTMFRWTGGGQSVQLMGSFDDWNKRISLVHSEDEFVCIVDLPVGRHEYKYLVDGVWSYDPHEPHQDNGMHSYNNVVTIKHSDFEVFKALAADDNSSPPVNQSPSSKSTDGDDSFGQELPSDDPSHQRPPSLPPQLLQILLNRETPTSVDPTVLHVPQVAELNHLCALSIKGGVITMCSTHRYKKKYITTVFYQPI